MTTWRVLAAGYVIGLFGFGLDQGMAQERTPVLRVPRSVAATRPDSAGALFAVVKDGVQGPPLWKALLSESYILSSEAETTFHFDYTLIAPIEGREKDGNRFLRAIADYDGRSCGLCVIGQQMLPIAIYSDGYQFAIPNREWTYWGRGRWGFLIDGEHLDEFLDGKAVPKDKDCVIRFDPKSFFEEVARDEIPATVWIPASRTLAAKKKNGTVIYFRFRTPDDALLYGTELGEITLFANGAVETFRAFIKGNGYPSPTRIVPGETLVALLAAKKELPTVKDWGTIDLNNDDSLTAGVEGSRAIARVDSLENRARHVRVAKEILRLLDLEASVIPRNGEKVDKNALNAYAKQIAVQLRTMATLPGAETPRYPDDPVMIWTDLDARLGPEKMAVLFVCATRVVKNDSLSDDVRIDLLDAIGDCGPPAFLGEANAFQPLMSDPFVDAVLRSRWQWPCVEVHVLACQRCLKESGPDTAQEAVAVETLIRLGELEKVPEASRDRWYRKFLADADASVRKQSLAVLTLHPSGRSFLRARAEKLARPDPLRAEFVATLRSRAEAVRQTRRFEFMSETESAALLEFAK